MIRCWRSLPPATMVGYHDHCSRGGGRGRHGKPPGSGRRGKTFQFQLKSFHFQLTSFHFQLKSFQIQLKSFIFQSKFDQNPYESFDFQLKSFDFQLKLFNFQLKSFHFPLPPTHTTVGGGGQAKILSFSIQIFLMSITTQPHHRGAGGAGPSPEGGGWRFHGHPTTMVGYPDLCSRRGGRVATSNRT